MFDQRLLASTMDEREQAENLIKKAEMTQIDFVFTELSTAITFCEIATSAADPERKKRNVANAREGYAVAMRFARGAALSPKERKLFDDQTRELKSRLQDLGERF
jgi:hypothetical protein